MTHGNPLDSLTRLGPNLYLHEPSHAPTKPLPTNAKHTVNPTTTLPPTTILLCAWFAANPRHLTRYISAYTTTYPTSRLIIALSTFRDISTRSYAAQQRRLQPVIYILKADVQRTGRSDDTVLVHCFSNGGANTFCQIAQAWRASSSARDAAPPLIPVKALVLDSCPGQSSWRRTIHALRISLPVPLRETWIAQPLALALLSLFLLLLYLARLVTGQENIVSAARRDLLDRTLVQEESRVYIYGGRDELVPSGDVESHAAEARGKGFSVGCERFEEGRHVACVLVDARRYWRIVAETWEGD